MRNWKTTTSAVIAAISGYLYADPSIIKAIPEPYQFWAWKLLGFLSFAGLIGIGATAKDFNVAGVPADQSPPAKQAALQPQKGAVQPTIKP
jgi:hypothetical protein